VVEDRYATGAYGRDNPGWHAEDAPHKAKILAEVLRGLEPVPELVVDVGCGTGGVLAHLKALLDRAGLERTRYQGWDVAPEAVERARALAGPRLDFVLGDLAAAELRADLVLCVDVVEHLVDDLAFLVALRSRGQRFLFRLPLDLSALDVVRPHRLLAARRRWGHLHAYSRATALQLLSEAGYRALQVSYDRVPPEVEGLRGRAVDAVRRGAFRIAPHATVAVLGGWSLVVLAEPLPSDG